MKLMSISKKITKITLMHLLSLILSFFLFITCKGGVNILVVYEQNPLNGNLEDQATPTGMIEDENYFYCAMNLPWRAKKIISYPEGYKKPRNKVDKNLGTPEYEPLPEDDNRIIPQWEVLNRFNTKHSFAANAVSCRALVYFKGTVYGSFSDERLLFPSTTEWGQYNYILKLNEEGVWVDTTIPHPNIEAPALDTTDYLSIDSDKDRLFGYLEDLSLYQGKPLSSLSNDEKNSYELAKLFYTNQIRRSEAGMFYVVEDQLYILYNDAYIRNHNPSSSIVFGKNPLMRLYKVKDIETTPSLELVHYDKSLPSESYCSEKELLEAIKNRMSLENESYGIARAKVLKEKLFRKSISGDKESIKFYDDAGESSPSVSYTQIKFFFLPHTVPSHFTRSLKEESTGIHLFLCKEGLFQLDTSGINEVLISLTDKIPYGVEINLQSAEKNVTIIDSSVRLPQNVQEQEELKKKYYTRYRIIDFYTYQHPESLLQHTCVATAMQNPVEKGRRYDVWRYTGNILDATNSSWQLQSVESNKLATKKIKDSLSNNSSNEWIPTSFVFYSTRPATPQEGYPITDERMIHKLLLGSNKGFFTADPNPSSTSVLTPFEAISLARANEVNYCYTTNILTLPIANGHITGFYPTVAKVDGFSVPICFFLTAGNGLWLNYNRYLSLE